MNAAPRIPLVVDGGYSKTDHSSCIQDGKKVNVREVGDFPQSDPYAYRRFFVVRWQAFCRATFPSISALARDFAVDRKTVRAWWNGESAPNGATVDYLYRGAPAHHRNAYLSIVEGGE